MLLTLPSEIVQAVESGQPVYVLIPALPLTGSMTWVSHLASWSLTFFIYRLGVITGPSSTGFLCGVDERAYVVQLDPINGSCLCDKEEEFSRSFRIQGLLKKGE